MKLDYNIIWVDDRIESAPYKGMKRDILEFLKNEFFNCQIQEAEDFDGFKNLYNDSGTYDLIITDLSLNDETTGKQVIDFIREHKHNHTEIFFYSANTKLRQQELVNSNRITFYQLTEGNYKELKDEIIELIQLTISKFQHIVTMRGMIMQETSILDVKMATIVKDFIFNPKNKDFVEDIINPILAEIQKNAKEKYEKANSSKTNKILNDNLLFNSSQKIFALGEILKRLDQTNFSDEYNDEIIWHRNQFAHAEIFKNENGEEYFKIKIQGEDKEMLFDQNKCREIRQNIIKHKTNIENLVNIINS